MNSTARAAVLEHFNQPLVVRSFPLPRLEPGSALVRTQMAGICGTDIHLWKGELPIKLPVILGHETLGQIEALGSKEILTWTGEKISTGDRVTWNSSRSCGVCFYCSRKGQPTRCRERRAYGIGYPCDQPPHFLGGYADVHYLQPGTTLFKIPFDLPSDAVIGAGCALITAIHGLERVCLSDHAFSSTEDHAGKFPEIKMPTLPALWSDSVVVQGAGPVGIAAVAVAKNAGAKKVIVIGAPSERLAIAKRFGADATIDLSEMPDPKDRIAAVHQLTEGYGADLVVECVGHPSAVPEGVELCRDGGKYLVLGHYCDAGSIPFNFHLVTRKQLQVFGSWSSEPRHLAAALNFLVQNRKRFPFETMISHRFPIEQAHEGLLTTARWAATKTVIVP